LFYEIRPIDPERATAFTVTNETPAEHRDQLRRHATSTNPNPR
jgi:hypothetical protein